MTATYPTIAPQTTLLGEILTWSSTGVKVRHLDLIDALQSADLDESVARELAPRHAFARACRKLSERRIIRPLSEDAATIRFQFTQETREDGRYRYDLETVLTLTKATGKVECDLPGLATLAQEQLDECIALRNGSDITRILQRLFDRHADLFPIRESGGCYFVPQRHAKFVDRIDCFVRQLNGSLRRFPVPAGTPQGDRSVREAIAAGLASVIAEHRAAVATFGDDTRTGTLERAAERIQQTRFKVELYATYLADEKQKLERDLMTAQRELRAKVEALASTEPALATAS